LEAVDDEEEVEAVDADTGDELGDATAVLATDGDRVDLWKGWTA